MLDKTAIGRRVAQLRKELAYSQAAFAEKLHVTAQAVSKWETGLTLPDIETLLHLSWLTKTSLHTILEGEDFTTANSTIDRGLLRMEKHLACPQCGAPLTAQLPIKQEQAYFACANGHRYEIADGVLHFGSREIPGELWSLWLRNYEHYLQQEQRYPGNPRYQQGNPHCKEMMWRHIKALRPRTILDIACGSGNGIKYMIERIDWPVTIIMADVSHRILKWNRIFYAEEWHNPYVDMAYLACDCAKLPLADNCIDLVFSNFGFESMQEKMLDGFREANRVLKPGAHAVHNISAINNPSDPDTAKWLTLYAEETGENADKPQTVAQWLTLCRSTGYRQSEATQIYDELPAPTDGVFPFENEILQWMALHVVTSEK